jgi:hypothetical protein
MQQLHDSASAATQGYALVIPHTRYEFTVRNAGKEYQVEWANEVYPIPTDEARRLHELITLIEQILSTYPAYQQLPEQKVHCL